jgi:hypothetical protein
LDLWQDARNLRQTISSPEIIQIVKTAHIAEASSIT